jgi:hypothetical protein
MPQQQAAYMPEVRQESGFAIVKVVWFQESRNDEAA